MYRIASDALTHLLTDLTSHTESPRKASAVAFHLLSGLRPFKSGLGGSTGRSASADSQDQVSKTIVRLLEAVRVQGPKGTTPARSVKGFPKPVAPTLRITVLHRDLALSCGQLDSVLCSVAQQRPSTQDRLCQPACDANMQMLASQFMLQAPLHYSQYTIQAA